MNDVLVPISPGELLDKITILRIKAARITDTAKVGNVRLELGLLEKTWQDSGCAAAHVAADERALARGERALMGRRGPDPREGSGADFRPRLHRAGASGLRL